MEMSLSLRENSDMNICLDLRLAYLEHGNYVMMLTEDEIKLQVFLNSLNDSVCIFVIHFALSEC